MKLKERIHRFLHDEKLKRKLYVIIFESDTPAGKLFDVILIGCILVSVLLVIIESLKGLHRFLHFRVPDENLLLAPSPEIHIQLLRNRRLASHPSALHRPALPRCTLSAHHPCFPPDTGIPCLQALQLSE